MIYGMPSRNACGHLCQLEVHQLLQSENQVVYPKGLNGVLELVLTSLPESLTHSMSMLNDPAFPLVDLSSVMSGDQVHKTSAPHRTSTPPSPTHLTMEHPPKADSHIGMTAEVQDLLSHAMLDTSSQALGSSTPKRPTSLALGTPTSSRAENTSKPVATSSQASLQVAISDDTEPINQTSKGVGIPSTLSTKTLRADTGILPKEVLLLEEEMNRMMGHLLTTMSSLDTH